MPVQYSGALQEHLAVRKAVGVFDVSHMGEIEVRGEDALPFLQRVTCNDVSRLGDQQAQYSALLYPQGTFVDDILIYRFARNHFLICVNAANREKDYDWMLKHRSGSVSVEDTSDRYVQLAIQGPRAADVLQQLTPLQLSTIKNYRFAVGPVCDVECIVSRTGYTGEDGFELYLPPSAAEKIWRALFEAGKEVGIQAAGLAARNTLRLEVRYPLYGNDIDETTTPLEAGLGWIVKLSKEEDFIGRQALESQKSEGVRKQLAGFEMVDSGIARDGYRVFFDSCETVVTSGSYSPSLERAIGLVYLPPERAVPGEEIAVEIRGRKRQARVVETPFYKK